MEKVYKFNRNDYNEDGFNINNGELFLDLIHKWEEDFYKCFYPFNANYMFTNSSTMILMKNCMVDSTNEDYGRDGEIDLETEHKIEIESDRITIYAIGSELKEKKDEPIYLIIDNTIGDGTVIYKYIKDDDEETDEIIPDLPVWKNELIMN